MATRAIKRVEETPKGTSMGSFHDATLSLSKSSSTRIFCTRSGENVSTTTIVLLSAESLYSASDALLESS